MCDIEISPGPDKNYKSLICCRWNVNGLTPHNILKLSLIAAYNSIHKYDFICISGTCLDSSVQSDDRDISINGCHRICADHPSNNKRGGVCIYDRKSLAAQLVKITNLNECLLCEVSVNNKVTLQSYKDPPAKIDWNLILPFQISKRCLVIFTLLTLIFQLFLAILMLEQIGGGLVILKHLKCFSHNFLRL